MEATIEIRFKKAGKVVATIPGTLGTEKDRYSAALDVALLTWKALSRRAKKPGNNHPWAADAWDSAEVHDKWISRENYERGLSLGKLL